MKPFLKWPGGKRWIIPFLRSQLGSRKFARYYEPFLGGGALLFGLGIRPATAGDINGDLIEVYRQVVNSPELLQRMLRDMPVDALTYRQVRATVPDDPLERAARFLYLNRTAFAGMYRLNRAGQFNVPFGGGTRTPEPLWRDDMLVVASQHLCNVELMCADFEETLSTAGAGDLVYCDPTYTVTHNNNGFVRYNELNFSWHDQVRLAATCQSLVARQATVVVSNAASKDVKQLYEDAQLFVLERKTLLSPQTKARGTTAEYLFVLGPEPADGDYVDQHAYERARR